MCDEKITLDQDISRFYVALVDGQACLYAFVRTERVDSRGRGTYTAYMDAAWDMLAFASHTYDNAYYTVDRNWSLRSTEGDPDIVGSTTIRVDPQRCVLVLDLAFLALPLPSAYGQAEQIIRDMYERASEYEGGPQPGVLCGFEQHWRVSGVMRTYSRISVNLPRWRKTSFGAGMGITNSANFPVLSVGAGVSLW